MIHNICKQEGRMNTMVYGCVSDGDQFTFLRIDNEDKVIKNLIYIFVLESIYTDWHFIVFDVDKLTWMEYEYLDEQ